MTVRDNVISLATALFRRSELANQAGKTFLGNRDMYKELGYQRNLSFADYNDRYARGGIAAKIVDAFASATWRNKPEIKSTETFMEEYEKLAQRIKLYHYLERIDKLAGIGNYGVLLFGVRGGSPESPIRKVRNADDILYLAPFTQGNAEILTLTEDASNPRFALPETYQLNMVRDMNNLIVKNFPAGQAKVHWSRILHVADGLQEDDILGTPRMQKVWNYLDDLEKIAGAGAEGVWKTVDRGIQFDVDKEMDLDEDDEEAFADEIAEYMHGLKRYFKTKGITANVLGSNVADPRGPFNVAISLISGTTGIPQRVLLGSERGELASSQDERNFNGRVKERQTGFATPIMLRPTIDKFIDIGALPEEEYEVIWPDPSTLTDKELSDVAARNAQSIRNVSGQSQGDTVIAPSVFAKKYLNLTEEELAETERFKKEKEEKAEKLREEQMKAVKEKDEKNESGAE